MYGIILTVLWKFNDTLRKDYNLNASRSCQLVMLTEYYVLQEEERQKRDELDRIMLENKKKIEDAQRKLAEEQLKLVEEERRMLEQRQQMEEEDKRRKKRDQEVILNKKNARPRLSFAIGGKSSDM